MAELPTATAGERTERRYDFLGLRVTVSSDRPETLKLLDALYCVFSKQTDAGSSDLDLALRSQSADGGGAILEVMGHAHPLARPPLTDLHAYSILLGELFQRFDDFFLVHGAAISNGDSTLLISGPSGHGKTTLSLDLLGQGFRLLSDDFAPIGRSDGRIHPFPKRIGLKRGPRGTPSLPRHVQSTVELLPKSRR